MTYQILIPNHDEYSRMHKVIESLYANYPKEFIETKSITFLCSGYDPNEWFSKTYPEVKFKYFGGIESCTNSKLIKEYSSEIGSTKFEYTIVLTDSIRFNNKFFEEIEQYLYVFDDTEADSVLLVRAPQSKKSRKDLIYEISDYSLKEIESYAGVIVKEFSSEDLGNEDDIAIRYLYNRYFKGNKIMASTITSGSRFKLIDKSIELVETQTLPDKFKGSSLAIVSFEDTENLNGVYTSTYYLKDQLKLYYDRVDITSTLDQSQLPGIYCTSNFNYLNKYEFIIFMTPGILNEKESSFSEEYYKILISRVKTPFAFVVHGEVYTSLLPYYHYFLNSPYCRCIIYNAKGMEEKFPEFTEKVPLSLYVDFVPKFKPLSEILEKSKLKSRILTSTSRWIPVKRIRELILMTPELFAKNIFTTFYGTWASTFYVRKIKEDLIFNPKFLGLKDLTDKETLEYLRPKIDKMIDIHHFNNLMSIKGSYTPNQVPQILKDSKWHYNISFVQKTSSRRLQVTPRLELATLEAFQEGCLPLVCRETTPDWLENITLLRFPQDDLGKLPEVLDSMMDSEIKFRLTSFYEIATMHYSRSISSLVFALNNLKRS